MLKATLVNGTIARFHQSVLKFIRLLKFEIAKFPNKIVSFKVLTVW